MQGKLRAVIFDCDGVLFDSLPANEAYYNAILTRLGLPPMGPTQLALAHRGSTLQFFQTVFGNNPEKIEQARQVALSIDYEPFYRLMQPAPRLHETLGSLRKRYRLGMATNRGFTAREVVRRFGLEEYLAVTVGTRDVERPKPHPDMLLRCAEWLGVNPREAVYVGDAETDAQAANLARMHFIGVGAAVDTRLRVDRLDQVPAALRLLEEGTRRSA